MLYTIPATCKVRALRIPADGSPPHVLTLETLMHEPDPFSEPTSYHGLLSSLQKEESLHLPDLHVFWGRKGWKRRHFYRIEYECKDCQKLEGHYYVFRTLESDGFQVNGHLSNDFEEHHGDVFVLKAAEEFWRDEDELDRVMDRLEEFRHKWLYPEYVDVDEDIVLCDIDQAIARLLLQEAAVQMDTDDQETQRNNPPISDDRVQTTAEQGVEQGPGSTATPFSKDEGEIQEKEGESTNEALP